MGNKIVTHSPKTDWFQVVYYSALAKRPPAPLDGALNLIVVFVFPRPNSARGASFKSTKPDLDNLIKVIKDAMTQARWWVDDGRVSVMTVLKRFTNEGEEPGALVAVSALENEEDKKIAPPASKRV